MNVVVNNAVELSKYVIYVSMYLKNIGDKHRRNRKFLFYYVFPILFVSFRLRKPRAKQLLFHREFRGEHCLKIKNYSRKHYDILKTSLMHLLDTCVA